MATFKATIKKDKQRADKTWNVLIRFTHNRKTRYLSTTMYVTKKDLTASFRIKNQRILDRCDELIREYRKKIDVLIKQIVAQNLETGELTFHSLNNSPEYSDFQLNMDQIRALYYVLQKKPKTVNF